MNMNERVNAFTEFMRLPDGTPLCSDDCMDWLKNKGFFAAPASTKYHGNYKGGLFDHSIAVARVLTSLTRLLGLHWKDQRSPYIVGMFHDLCKIDQYRHPPLDGLTADGRTIIDSDRWEYRTDTPLKGHGDKSVMLLSQFYTLTEEEILCIRYHMGAFVEKDEWNLYTGAIHLYDTVLYTHHADMIASHVIGV